MNGFTRLATVLVLGLAAAAPLPSQAADLAHAMMKDHSMRTSMLIGAPVYNGEGQTIGSIVDILVKNQPAEPTAILSVGDFIGGGTKLVAVPLSHVKLEGSKMNMAASKQELSKMPSFAFNPVAGGGG